MSFNFLNLGNDEPAPARQMTESELFKEEFRRRGSFENKATFFKLYFVVIVVAIGGIGNWAAIVAWGFSDATSSWTSFLAIFQNVGTYAVAIAATSFIDYVLSLGESNAPAHPFRNSFSMVLVGGFVLTVALCFWTYFPLVSPFAIVVGILSCVAGVCIALFTWWIANADNSKLFEKVPESTAPVGGKIEDIAGDPKALEKTGLD